MANLVEYIVKIRDVASGQMRQLGNTSTGVFNQMSSRINRVGGSVDQLTGRIDALTKTRNLSLDTRQITAANKEISALERKRDLLESRGVGKKGGSMLATGLLLGGVGLAVAGVGNMLKNGMDRQMAGASFNVMAGNKEGGELHKNLIRFATDTIYGNEVFGEAKMMLGFGVAAKNVMPSMKMLGDIAMGNVENMKSLTLGFSEAASMGKLTGRELLILADAGFNPLDALSKKTGKSMAVLRDDMAKGKISFADLTAAMKFATGPMGRFHDGMKNIGNTDTGKWIAFTGAMETLSGTIGMQLLPAVGGLVDIFNWMGQHTALMYGIATAVGVMTAAWGVYTLWVQRAAIWQGILDALVFWPIAVISLLVGAIVWLVKSFDGWGKSLNALWQITKSVFGILGVIFKEAFQEWIFNFDLLFLKAKSVFEYIGTLIGNVVRAMKAAFSGDFAGAKNILTAHITTDADKQIDTLRKERAGQYAANTKSIADDMKTIGQQWKNVGLTKAKGDSKSTSSNSWRTSQFDPKGQTGSGTPGSVADTAKGISGGGVRNQTINIAKLGTDTITIHAASLKEGTVEIKEMFMQLFNQVVNSGNAAVSPQ